MRQIMYGQHHYAKIIEVRHKHRPELRRNSRYNTRARIKKKKQASLKEIVKKHNGALEIQSMFLLADDQINPEEVNYIMRMFKLKRKKIFFSKRYLKLR